MADYNGIPVTVEEAPKPKNLKSPRTSTTTGLPRASHKPDPEPKPLNREQGVYGLLSIVATGLSFVDPVDSVTVAVFAPGIAQGAAEVAANDKKFAAILDNILQAGPYGALLTPVMMMGFQIAANHGLIKPGVFGTKTRDEMLEMAEGPPEMSLNGSEPATVS